jgi:DNA-binding transcriptional ArsR family regulator
MVPEPNLDGVFRALADPTRGAMLRSLAGGERRIGDLAAPHSMSFAAASKHVRVLERAGLVRRRIEGRAHICRLEPAPLLDAEAWLRFYKTFWSAGPGRLNTMLSAEDEARAGQPRATPSR